MIIILFLPSFSNIANAKASNNIFYVDDEGDADFTTISEALTISSPGDTIFVYSGNYGKSNITKFGINLIGIPSEFGQGSDTGKPYVKRIHVYSMNVTVNNFRFVSQDGYYVIKIESGDNCKITNNTIYGNPNYYQGIFATKSKNFTIKGNDFYHLNTGIYIDRGDEFIITNNSFNDCPNHFISIVDTSNTAFSVISHNRIDDCRGVGIEYTISMLIISNNIFTNCNTAIDQYGVNSFSEWRENQINNNEFRNCDIGIDLSGMENVKDVPEISQNNFFNNQKDITFYQLLPLWYNKPTNPLIDNNYYDNSIGKTNKIHTGKAVVMYIPIILPLFRPPFIFVTTLPISIPWIIIDHHPANEPFDIWN